MESQKYGESDGEKLKKAEVRTRAAMRPIDQDTLFLQLNELKERAEQRADNAELRANKLQMRVTELERENACFRKLLGSQNVKQEQAEVT